MSVSTARKRTFPILILGASSMPGWSLLAHPHGRALIPFCGPHAKSPACAQWGRIDLEDPEAFTHFFRTHRPPAIVYCAGVCDVEKCQNHPAWAHTVNVDSVARMLKTLPASTRLVYISSDHVFAGRPEPYNEKTPPDPLTVYGRTRTEAEILIRSARPDALILRYALGIGGSADGRTGHLDWLKNRTKKDLPISIVEGEHRSAVWAKDLALRILEYTESDMSGIRHITATRPASRVELAHSLNSRYAIGARYNVISREERPVPHLGRVELATVYSDELAAPLKSALD